MFAECDQQPCFLVPPAKRGNLGIVPIENARLREGGGGRDAAPIGPQFIALLLDQALEKRHASLAQGLLCVMIAQAVYVQDDETV